MLVGDVLPGVNEYRVVVRVNGVARAVESVSWDTEMSGDLPDQVIASGGLGGASGTIAWAPQEAVQSRPVSPWAKVANWPPSPGDLVQVQVSDGVNTWTRFTGVIDKTSGSAGAGYQSSVIDFRDRITGTFTHEALLRHHVPQVEDGAYRSIGLDHWYPLTAALSSAGFNNVPPTEANAALSAKMQGSVWPVAGTVRTVSGVVGSGPSFPWQDYGYAVSDVSANYLPRLSESSATPVQVTVVVPGTHAGVATIDTMYGPVTIRLRVSNSRGVTAFYSPTGSAPWTTVASVGGQSASVTTVVQLLVKGGAWTLRTSNGSQGTGSQALAAGNMSTVLVNADTASRIAGVQVSHPNSTAREFASLGFTPNMRFSPSGLASTMDMMPALKGRKIGDLVDEILTATLTASWWDETGALILRPSNLLRTTAPSQTVTTDMDVTALAWEDSLLSVRSAVEVAWKAPSISKGKQHRLELWRGPEESFVSGDDPREQFVTPESGVEWFGVDRTVRKLDEESWGAYNSRRGSYGGLRYEDSNGNEVPTTVASVGVTTENLYADSMIITTTVYGISGSNEGVSATSTTASALRPQMRGKALPVVRGMAIGEWVDATYSKAAGPVGPVLQHDLGYWGGEFFGAGSVAQRIGDYLAGMVTAPQPTITDLGLVYDPRRQLGDVYTLRSEWLGIELRLLVTRISESHAPGEDRQSLTVRVISATSTRPVTYEDLAAAWGTGNYAGLQAAWAALNYTALGANPLEGAPS